MWLAGCSASSHYADLAFPHKWAGVLDEDRRINEPSGIVFHPARRTLFVVDDEGALAEVTTDGQVLRNVPLTAERDYEGVTFDPATGMLYLAAEGDEQIVEVDPDTFAVTRIFAIDRHLNGNLRLKPGGQGIEAITFVPDADHPEGGTFFVANQAFSLHDPEDPSALFEVEAPLRSGEGDDLTARIVRMIRLDLIDLSGLHYDASADRLLVISDAENMILHLTRSGQVVSASAFPGDNQEGIAFDADGYVYIAQDSGGVLKVKWRRE